MKPDNYENDEVTKAIQESLPDNLSPLLETRMRGSLREFRQRLDGHSYVRRLNRGQGLWATWSSRWQVILATFAVGFVLVTVGLDHARQSRLDVLADGKAYHGIGSPIDPRMLNIELDKLLAQAPDNGLSGGRKGGNPL
jgi:hypothetical protein